MARGVRVVAVAFLLESDGLLRSWNQARPSPVEAAAIGQAPRGDVDDANEGSRTAQPNGPCNADTGDACR